MGTTSRNRKCKQLYVLSPCCFHVGGYTKIKLCQMVRILGRWKKITQGKKKKNRIILWRVVAAIHKHTWKFFPFVHISKVWLVKQGKIQIKSFHNLYYAPIMCLHWGGDHEEPTVRFFCVVGQAYAPWVRTITVPKVQCCGHSEFCWKNLGDFTEKR